MFLACMKGISGIGAFLILLVGLGMTGITIYGMTHSELFLNDTSERKTILGILIAADLIIILGSIMGIYGLRKSNALLICIFQILVIIFLVVFFGLAIAAEVMPSKFFDGNCDSSGNPTLVQAYNTTVKANLFFCRKLPIVGGCPCNLSNDTYNGYNILDRGLIDLNYGNRNDSGVKNFQSCSDSVVINVTQADRDMATALGAIEDLFQCSGWCDNQPANNLIYLFSDVNKGKPKVYCYNKLKEEVGKYANVVGAGAFITTGFLLLISLINICICCHPARRKLKFKDRFVYINNGEYQKV